MTVIPHQPPPIPRGAAPVPTDVIWPLTVRQYHEMVRIGILTDDDPVELLEGLLVVKMPRNPQHTTATKVGEDSLDTLLPAGWYVRVQEPITLADSEPEPDLAVVRGAPRRYLNRHPGPRDVALVVEVADTTLARDKGPKLRAYAAARLPIYWVVNLPDVRVEVYTEPTGPAARPTYRRHRIYLPTEEVPFTIGGRGIGLVPAAHLLPAPKRPRRRETRP
jgi:Uma2 family endonuclease